MKYTIDAAVCPVWEGGAVYNETVWPVDLYGGELLIPLLYHADRILSVTDTSLQTEFVQGRDYELKDGKLLIIRGGGISVTPRDGFFLKEPQSESPFKIGAEGGGWLFFGEGDWITKKQICVTYLHGDAWNGFRPEPTSKLPRTRTRIADGAPFTFAFFGDSITYGCNSSGMKDIMVPPFVPTWPAMTVDYLNRRGGHVGYINRAVGGMNCRWGAEQMTPLFGGDKFDLMLIAFGMNDPSTDGFEENTEKMIEDALKINPDCEFLLLSTTLPHKLAAGFYCQQYMQQPILERICEKYGDIAELVPMTDMHSALLSKKRFFDMTGNNVNHPNDFLAAVHAQTILRILGVR